jgi:hypothetical protein
MKEIVFHTRLFPTAPEGDLEFNNGMPGSAAATWVRAAVEAAGVACGDVSQEDYGWGFWLKEASPVWVAVGYATPIEETDDAPEWRVMISLERSLFSPAQWFKGAQGRALVERVAAAIEYAMADEPAIVLEPDAG